MAYARVTASDKAVELIDILREIHGSLMFHQSGGCCDGSSPMCFALGEFRVGGNDVLLGEVNHCPFYMDKDQFKYWQNTHLTVDVTEGRGSSFSLEIPMGLRFVVVSRLFRDEELADLTTVVDCISS